jgi:hypothetical protein
MLLGWAWMGSATEERRTGWRAGAGPQPPATRPANRLEGSPPPLWARGEGVGGGRLSARWVAELNLPGEIQMLLLGWVWIGQFGRRAGGGGGQSARRLAWRVPSVARGWRREGEWGRCGRLGGCWSAGWRGFAKRFGGGARLRDRLGKGGGRWRSDAFGAGVDWVGALEERRTGGRVAVGPQSPARTPGVQLVGCGPREGCGDAAVGVHFAGTAERGRVDGGSSPHGVGWQHAARWEGAVHAEGAAMRRWASASRARRREGGRMGGRPPRRRVAVRRAVRGRGDVLPGSVPVAAAVCSCGNPGRWSAAGFPTGVGRSGGGWVVVRSFPYPVRFHSRGGRQVRLRSRGYLARWAGEVRSPRTVPGVPRTVRGPRRTAARTARRDFCDPHPFCPPSDQLSRESWRSKRGTKPRDR